MTNSSKRQELSSSQHDQLSQITGCNTKMLVDGRILVMKLPCADYNRIAKPKTLSFWQHLQFSFKSMFSSLPPCLDRLPEATKLGYKEGTVKALSQAARSIEFLESVGHTASIAVVEIDWITDGMIAIQLVDFGVVIDRPSRSNKSSTNQLPSDGAK